MGYNIACQEGRNIHTCNNVDDWPFYRTSLFSSHILSMHSIILTVDNALNSLAGSVCLYVLAYALCL